MPVVAPANVAEILEFGWPRLGAVALLGQLGRADRAVGGGGKRHDGGSRCDQRARRCGADADAVRAATGHAAPADGLHYRWPDLPSLRIESRLHDKLAAVRASRASTASTAR